MKKLSFFVGLILMVISCSNDRVESVDDLIKQGRKGAN